MANKMINVLMSLKDRFTKPMTQVTKKTKEAQKQFKLAQNTISNFGESANDTFVSLSKETAKLGAEFAAAKVAAVALGGVMGAVKGVELAKTQIVLEQQFANSLKNTAEMRAKGGEAWKEAQSSLLKYAKQVEKTTAYTDEMVIAGLNQMAIQGLTTEQMKGLAPLMSDVLANTKGLAVETGDFEEMGLKLSEAIQGDISSLEDFMDRLSETEEELYKNMSEQERYIFLTERLAKTHKGAAKELANTDAGKLSKGLNSVNSMLTNVGKKLTPFIGKLGEAFSQVMPKLETAILPIVDKIANKFDEALPNIINGVSAFADKLPKIIDKVGEAFNFIGEAVDVLLPIVSDLVPVIVALGTGFAAFNIIDKVAGMFGTLKGIMTGVSAAGGLLNFVMAMNPFALVAIAIGALVGAFIYAYKNSETFRVAVQELWEKLKTFGSYAMEIFAPLLSGAWEVIKVAFKVFTDLIGEYLTAMVNAFNGVIDFIVGVFTGDWEKAWDGVKRVFSSIFDGIKAIALAPLEFITGVVDKLLGKLGKVKAPKTNDFRNMATPESNALGTSYFGGGSTYVNEGNRGELINLPSGSQIIPHDLAKRAIGGSQNINITLNVQGNVIGNDDFYNECGRVITTKLKTALANM